MRAVIARVRGDRVQCAPRCDCGAMPLYCPWSWMTGESLRVLPHRPMCECQVCAKAAVEIVNDVELQKLPVCRSLRTKEKH